MIAEIQEGLSILHRYDAQADVQASDNNIYVILVDTAKIADVDAEHLVSLGWEWEDSDLFLFDIDRNSSLEDEDGDN